MKRPEQELQIQVAKFLALALKPPVIWTAFPAGGGGKVRGAILKAMGLRTGFPDILVLWPENGYVKMLGIELKSSKGRSSPAQIDMELSFRHANGGYRLCRSLDDVDSALFVHRVPTHARLPR